MNGVRLFVWLFTNFAIKAVCSRESAEFVMNVHELFVFINITAF